MGGRENDLNVSGGFQGVTGMGKSVAGIFTVPEGAKRKRKEAGQ